MCNIVANPICLKEIQVKVSLLSCFLEKIAQGICVTRNPFDIAWMINIGSCNDTYIFTYNISTYSN